MYTYTALVARVVDGDTVDLVVDLGLRVGTKGRFRLAGLNAAEHNTDAGVVATHALEGLLPVGSEVQISTHKDSTEKYGRWLATVFKPGSQDSINQQMISLGYAKAWDGKGERP